MAETLSGNTLLSFAALRRQAVGAGASFKTRVVVRIASLDGEARVALCVKDARVAAQQPATRLRSCEPAPWPQRGRRLWLTFHDDGGDGARRFDVELQTDAEVALLKARAHARRRCAAARLRPAEACASSFAMRLSRARLARPWTASRAAPPRGDCWARTPPC